MSLRRFMLPKCCCCILPITCTLPKSNLINQGKTWLQTAYRQLVVKFLTLVQVTGSLQLHVGINYLVIIQQFLKLTKAIDKVWLVFVLFNGNSFTQARQKPSTWPHCSARTAMTGFIFLGRYSTLVWPFPTLIFGTLIELVGGMAPQVHVDSVACSAHVDVM